VRILLVAHHLPPRHEAGTEVYTTRLATELSRRHQVEVFATDDDPLLRPGSTRTREGEGYRITEVAEPRLAERAEATWISPRVEAAFEAALATARPEVVHFQNVRFLGFGVVRAARRSGARTIFTLNDHWLLCARDGLLVDREGKRCAGPEPDRCLRCLTGYRFGLSPGEARAGRFAARLKARVGLDLTPWLRRIALLVRGAAKPSAVGLGLGEALERRREGVRRLFEAVDVFVAPSRFIADLHRQAGVPSDKMCVLSYGTDPGSSRTGPRSSGGPLRIGYFGTVASHKGPDLLIEALAQMPPGSAEVVVHGRDDLRPEYAASLRRRARGLAVRFAGAYRFADGPALTAGLDVVVVPSRWPENLPQAALEARACGVPVIAADVGGLPEIVRHGVDGALFPADDVDALAAVLRAVADDRSILDRWRAALSAPLGVAEHVSALEALYASSAPARSTESVR
jgi:glycosyltransferase involved in cell wall biosynthesis